ncbi:hypothetical protein GGS23DRAFT_474836 [Durotheca rogersii]|uniref:uncharacterized protein n=1 Tax=Durotheca rogersii TaxID=419775 RepID=UPI0022209EB1|nr:uncharacterized protein GGS23DRAFT_474836 [Durotheca rogersii]KAI5854503.1 hypothetical protein GGS23DRAFT_474836 [Durotheca rogersii]
MPSYVITGVSKGLGFAFLSEISNDPNNTVIGLVRDKPTTDKRVAAELAGRTNIHILQADITDYNALKQAAADTAKITGGSLDYLIANAGYVSQFDSYDPLGVLGNNPEVLSEDLRKLIDINVIGNIHLYNLFLPLILKGTVKKVIVISSGHADTDLINRYDVTTSPLYSISKGAMNVVTAKFSAQYKKDGVLFLSVCPGMVEVGHYSNLTPHQAKALGEVGSKFKEYAPDFAGPSTPEQAVRDVRKVWENATAEKDGGAFLSHFGNKQWL